MNKIIPIIFALCLVSLLFLNGCGEIPLREIRVNPEKYVGKEVTTIGIVNSTIKVLDFQAIKIQDVENKNSMLVYLSKDSALPPEGSRVIVRGIVKNTLAYYIEAIEIRQI